MTNHEILNGISAIQAAMSAFSVLREDVTEPEALEAELLWLLEGLCVENPALLAGTAIRNEHAEKTSVIGMCTAQLSGPNNARALLAEKLPALANSEGLSVPVEVDFSKGLTMVLEVDGGAGASVDASVMSQYVLLSTLKEKQALNFRCGDMAMGGSFFSSVHSLIAKFPKRTGGRVYTKPEDIDALLKDLEAAAAQSIAALGGMYHSVLDYNRSNTVKLQEYVAVIYLSKSSRSDDFLRRIRLLMENHRKNGISFILVGEGELLRQMEDLAEYYMRYADGQSRIGCKADLPFAVDESVRLSDDTAAELAADMQTAATVDTLYEHHPELHTDFFTMDSSEALRIPFAVDKDGIVQYFEIGGEAPSHALLSGSTGSGKSVALHTLIMQIVRNYHPDDVEIWAIDYKAVEFDSYMQHRTPHFRVIGYDTSTEFSLSLLDLLDQEYNRRMRLFLETGTKNIAQFRQKMGPHSMPRIIVFIDEFQIMTQAVQAYNGSRDYRTVLENLLKLTRAMGISFVFCSQTIATGLSGLTESARDQIGCRMCLKHDDDHEIRETLMLSGDGAAEIAARAKELRKGQSIYKRARWAKEHAPDGKAYEFKDCNILYINDELKAEMIDGINAKAAGTYAPKEEIIVRGGGRIPISDKVRHPMEKFLADGYEPEEDVLEWYPAAPTTLADAFCLELENTAGANILLVGENDDLRESITVHSLCGFLMNPNNHIVASFVDEGYSDRARMIGLLRNIASDRLTIHVGVRETLTVISKLKKIRPAPGRNTIYLWYGLDKLKNEIFLMNQDDDDEEVAPSGSGENMSKEDMIADLMNFLAEINPPAASAAKKEPAAGSDLSYEDCRGILRQAFEVGPENNHYHMVLFNNYKALKKSGLIELANFENRLGTRMSGDDSYDLFGSSLAISKTDDNTVIYYSGSGQPIPLRPYLMPDAAWYARFNAALEDL